MDKTLLTIEELESISGINRRNIRFYIQQGVLAVPEGSGRAARYTIDHLEQLRSIKALQAEGFTLSRIKEMRIKTENALLTHRPLGTPITRTEIGVVPGIFVSFIHETCNLNAKDMTDIVCELAKVLKSHPKISQR